MNIGIAIGKFQPYHKGHQMYLSNMLKDCDMLFVIVFGKTVKKQMPKDIIVNQIQESLNEKAIVISSEEAGIQGGHIPTAILNITNLYFNGNLNQDTIIVFGGADRLQEYQTQLSSIKETTFDMQDVTNLEDFKQLINCEDIQVKSPTGKNEILLSQKEQQLINKLNIKINTGSQGRVSGSLVRGLVSVSEDKLLQNEKYLLALFDKCVPTNGRIVETYMLYRKYYE